MHDLKAALEKRGFKVRDALDLPPEAALALVNDFAKDVAKADDDALVMFYFSGHGMQVERQELPGRLGRQHQGLHARRGQGQHRPVQQRHPEAAHRFARHAHRRDRRLPHRRTRRLEGGRRPEPGGSAAGLPDRVLDRRGPPGDLADQRQCLHVLHRVADQGAGQRVGRHQLFRALPYRAARRCATPC